MNFKQNKFSRLHWALRGTAIALLILTLSACNRITFPWFSHPTAESTPQAVSGQADIIMQMNAFHPGNLTVKVGTTITWLNKDPAYHSVIADGGQFKSGLLAIGQLFSFIFDQAGTYPYHCGVDGGPGGVGMSGEITVVP